MSKTNIVWFRKDLRLSDNLALESASLDANVILVYIFEQDNSDGAANIWWLNQSLGKLDNSLGHKLNFYIGDPKDILLSLSKKFNVNCIYWNREYEPKAIKDDLSIINALKEAQVKYETYNSSLLWEPSEVLKNDGTPYKVYTHFYRNGCLKYQEPRMPVPKPQHINSFKDPNSYSYKDYIEKMPQEKWHSKLSTHWIVGEDEAQRKMNHFLDQGIIGYKELRNYPNKKNVSRLSPHLHFGEISPNQIWYAVKALFQSDSPDIDHFLSEIAWREFSYYLLYHFPNIPNKNLQNKFDHFPWQENSELLHAWQRGMTGYPIVDAGMRELWSTGYMHNRVRMIVGSFLVKNLLIHWHRGAEWFWDCLVDADLASNSASWQWVAGSGADAAPYFRIFNPILQGEKFDFEGCYTKKFIPELKDMPNQFLFKPWLAPKDVLKKSNIELGINYPNPIVDLDSSRKMALKAYEKITVS